MTTISVALRTSFVCDSINFSIHLCKYLTDVGHTFTEVAGLSLNTAKRWPVLLASCVRFHMSHLRYGALAERALIIIFKCELLFQVVSL